MFLQYGVAVVAITRGKDVITSSPHTSLGLIECRYVQDKQIQKSVGQ